MNKLPFSHNELNRFLLIGEKNQYIIDKLNPLIRAVKRKDFLAIFCTLRVNNTTTSVKLGNFPESNLEEIYAKFEVAQKISKKGNNPNLIFNSLTKESDSTNLNKLVYFFLNKKKVSNKYSNDLTNNLKKNLGNYYYSQVNKITTRVIGDKTKELIKEQKNGTARNFLNYLTTIMIFTLKYSEINSKNEIVRILYALKSSKNLLTVLPVNKKIKNQKEILKKIKKLSEKQLKDILQILNKY